MGFMMILENTVFDPKTIGLSKGDCIDVICIGAGGGGAGAGVTNEATNNVCNGGDAGKCGQEGVEEGGGGGGGFGAGGGGAAIPSFYGYPGAGGGAGELKLSTICLQNNSTIAVTVGAKGKGGHGAYTNNGINMKSTTGNNGTNGGSTSFGAYLSANGGIGGGAGKSNSSSAKGGNAVWAMGNGGNCDYGTSNVKYGYHRFAGGGAGGYILGQKVWGGTGGTGGRYGTGGNPNISSTKGKYYGGSGGNYSAKTSVYAGAGGENGKCYPREDYAGCGVVILIW